MKDYKLITETNVIPKKGDYNRKEIIKIRTGYYAGLNKNYFIYHSENDIPSEEYDNGTKYWHKHDSLHRDNEPAIHYHDGHMEFYKDDELHREDGPAVIFSEGAIQEWWANGILHRVDGPAIMRDGGTNIWYYMDKRIAVSSQEEFEKWLKYRNF
jgi:hypothetical protein